MGTIAERKAPPDDAARIEAWLSALPPARLRTLAAEREIEAHGATGHDLTRWLANAMGSPQATERVLQACGPEASALLEYAMLWDNDVPLTILLMFAERSGMADQTRDDALASSVLNALMDRGLLLVKPISPSATTRAQRETRAGSTHPRDIAGRSSHRSSPSAPDSTAYVPWAVRCVVKHTLVLAEPSVTPSTARERARGTRTCTFAPRRTLLGRTSCRSPGASGGTA